MDGLARIHQNCQEECNLRTQGENSNANYQRAKTLIDFPSQHLSKLAVPIIFKFLKNDSDVQRRPRNAQHIVVERILNALVTNELHTVQDIRNEKPNASVQDVVTYLFLHHGQPSQVEALAKTRHEEIGRLVRPFLESNISLIFSDIKAHRSTFNSMDIMIKYFNETLPEKQALSKVLHRQHPLQSPRPEP